VGALMAGRAPEVSKKGKKWRRALIPMIQHFRGFRLTDRIAPRRRRTRNVEVALDNDEDELDFPSPEVERWAQRCAGRPPSLPCPAQEGVAGAGSKLCGSAADRSFRLGPG